MCHQTGQAPLDLGCETSFLTAHDAVQMRIALARLLLGPAGQSAASKDTGGVLLLDEPTNHLDNAAIKWLGNFLRTSGTMVTQHVFPDSFASQEGGRRGWHRHRP